MQYHISFFYSPSPWFKRIDVEMELVQQRKKRKGERGQMVSMPQTKREVGEREERVRCGGIDLLHNFFHCGLVSSFMFLPFEGCLQVQFVISSNKTLRIVESFNNMFQVSFLLLIPYFLCHVVFPFLVVVMQLISF
jgi:hypothetical protein